MHKSNFVAPFVNKKGHYRILAKLHTEIIEAAEVINEIYITRLKRIFFR